MEEAFVPGDCGGRRVPADLGGGGALVAVEGLFGRAEAVAEVEVEGSHYRGAGADDGEVDFESVGDALVDGKGMRKGRSRGMLAFESEHCQRLPM